MQDGGARKSRSGKKMSSGQGVFEADRGTPGGVVQVFEIRVWRLQEGSGPIGTDLERKPWGIINNSKDLERQLISRGAERRRLGNRGAQPRHRQVLKPALTLSIVRSPPALSPSPAIGQLRCPSRARLRK